MQSLILKSMSLLLLLAPAYWWWQSGSDIAGYVGGGAPPGQWAYLVAKLTGLYGFIAIWLQVSYGLARHQSILGKYRWRMSTHRWLGLATALLLTVHFGSYLLAVTLRNGKFPWQMLLPVFDAGQYRTALSLGLLSLVATGVAVIVGLLHRRGRQSRPRLWIGLHRLGIAALAAGLVHGMMVGTETNVIQLTLLYYAMAAVTGVLLINRVRIAVTGAENPS